MQMISPSSNTARKSTLVWSVSKFKTRTYICTTECPGKLTNVYFALVFFRWFVETSLLFLFVVVTGSWVTNPYGCRGEATSGKRQFRNKLCNLGNNGLVCEYSFNVNIFGSPDIVTPGVVWNMHFSLDLVIIIMIRVCALHFPFGTEGFVFLGLVAASIGTLFWCIYRDILSPITQFYYPLMKK